MACRALQEAESRLEETLERCEADEAAVGSLRSRLEAVTGVLQVPEHCPYEKATGIVRT